MDVLIEWVHVLLVLQRYNEQSLRLAQSSRPPIAVRVGVHTGPVPTPELLPLPS